MATEAQTCAIVAINNQCNLRNLRLRIFVANQKMKNETNFRKAKMNIYSALTRDYEYDTFSASAKTNPISKTRPPHPT
jgi:hypothetical protein